VQILSVKYFYSGIDYSHPDFQQRFNVQKNQDFIDLNQIGKDYNGHGTHVAGE